MADSKEKSVFEILNAVDVNSKKETKNGLSYLSWAWAWTETKKRFPDVNYKVYESDLGYPYHTDGRTCWVKCGVTIQGVEQIEYLSVMDFRNQSIPLEKVTSVDVIKTIQRCVTKAIGRFGLGLYIYAGEDLPEDASRNDQKASKTASKEKEVKQPIQTRASDSCAICGGSVADYEYTDNTGKTTIYKKADILKRSNQLYGAPVCLPCMMKKQAKKKEENK